jgi:hypothetical protein
MRHVGVEQRINPGTPSLNRWKLVVRIESRPLQLQEEERPAVLNAGAYWVQ